MSRLRNLTLGFDCNSASAHEAMLITGMFQKRTLITASIKMINTPVAIFDTDACSAIANAMSFNRGLDELTMIV